MVVPSWSEDDIAALHGNAAAVDGREAAGSFDDEAHGEGRVAVGAGDFVGHYQLQTRIEGVRSVGGI